MRDFLKKLDVNILNNVTLEGTFQPMLKALETNDSHKLYEILISLAPNMGNDLLKDLPSFSIYLELEKVLSYYTLGDTPENYVVDESIKDLWVDLASALTTLKCKFLKLQEWVEGDNDTYTYTEDAQEIFNEYEEGYETIISNVSTRNFISQ